jgi:hypothetical protein
MLKAADLGREQSEMVQHQPLRLQLTQAQDLTLLVAENAGGYFGVRPSDGSKSKPFRALR